MTPERWQQITDIFHAALARPEAERSAFLASTCGADTGLMRHVESMIAAHHEAGSFGDAPILSCGNATLPPGSCIGVYRIEQPIGAGGMGQVYKARDTRLGRTVAVKVLAPELADDPEFRSRFEREARTISRLEHHHICALYDVGEHDGVAYLVMQYLDGETLAQRLDRGPLPIADALTVAMQVADALDGAHTAGVVHRDLKPANIFLTRSGVKLLDFGLAKSDGSSASADASASGSGLTTPGVVLGTVPYMAPEQLEGRQTDHRTDLFALGAVIHEAFTGRRAFEGAHQATVISSIMSGTPPPISTIRPDAPSTLDRVVAGCLAKDPEARWTSARDVKRTLAWIQEPATGSTAIVPPRRRWPRDLALAGAAMLIGAVVAAGSIGWPFDSSPDAGESRAYRFEVVPEDGAAFGMSPAFMAVSPDGRSLAWHGTNARGQSGIWIRSLDSLTAHMIDGGENGVQPFWSPDGRFVAFSSAGKLRKVSTAGGLAQELVDRGSMQAGTWSQEGVIVFRHPQGTLHRVPAAGGPSTPVTMLDVSRGEGGHDWPQFLPDGKHFLFQARSTQAEYDGMLYVGSLDSADRVALFTADSHAVYAAPGYLLFMRSNTLVAQPFDADRLRTTGEPIPVAEQIEINTETRRGAFSVSPAGVLAYRPMAETRLEWVDRSGRALSTLGPPGHYRNPALSPDEQRVAIARIDADTGAPDIWVVELARQSMSRLTSHPLLDDMPIWSRDGRHIMYRASREGDLHILRRPAAGTGSDEPLLSAARSIMPMDLSHDGAHLIYAAADGGAFRFDLLRLPLSGDRTPIPLVRTEFNETQAQLSPDGRWMAYVSNDTGRTEVVLSPFPSGQGKWQISTGGGVEPRWRSDGRELFFIALDQSLMAVPVTTGETIHAGVPERLFETGMRGTLSASFTRNQYVNTGDGQRFLIDHERRGRSAASSITVVVDWETALRKPQ